MPGKPKPKKTQTFTANQLFTAFIVLTGSFLLFAVWPDMKESRHYDNYLASVGVKRSRIETSCTGDGDDRHCGFVAKKNIERGERVVSIPFTAVLQVGSVIKEEPFADILSPQGELLQEAFREQGFSSEYMFGPFAMTFKLWYEMKLGSKSSIWAWIDFMPKNPNHAIFFTDEEATCLDRASFEERNSSLTNARAFGNIAARLCEGRLETPCTTINSASIVSEFNWAYATLTQRVWGEIRQPMIIPVVDFAFPHQDLCNPNGDGDERCLGRDKQFFLQPKQESEDLLVMQAISMVMKGDVVYSQSQQRAPWETLAIYGYADYAAVMIPDLLFLNQFHKYTQDNRLDIANLPKDHPLKECNAKYNTAWSHTGMPKKELRDCWAAMFWFFENPDFITWDELAMDAWAEFKADTVAQAKFKYMAWLSTANSAENVAAFVVSNRGAHCDEPTGKLPVIKASMDISRGIFSRILSTAEKKKADAFAKWKALDEAADVAVPLPQPPTKEAVEEVAEEDEAESTE